jgi:methylated-DNA-protein-cysteine methyltransferase-like protein
MNLANHSEGDYEGGLGSSFRERVWACVRAVPCGKVVTYGQVAAMLGVPRAARAVGSVLHHTPAHANVPCQRVVNRFGGLAPTYGWGGMEQHKRELEADGVQVRPDYTVDLRVFQWHPEPGEWSNGALSNLNIHREAGV